MNTSYQVGDLFLCIMNHSGKRNIYEDDIYSIDYYYLEDGSLTDFNQRVVGFNNDCFVYFGKKINKLSRLFYA